MLAALALAVAAVPAVARQNGGGAQADNRRCLNCHGQTHIAELTPSERHLMLDPMQREAPLPEVVAAQLPPTRPGLYVGPEAFPAGTVHAGLRCVSCHRDADALPHPRDLAPASCSACHRTAEVAFDRSIHAAALARGDANAPRCASCHGAHDIAPSSDRASRTHKLNVIEVCGDCHEQHVPARDAVTGDYIRSYLDSVHGRAITEGGLLPAATCVDCHGSHEVLPPEDLQSTVHRSHIPATCGRCHLRVVETYSTSIHGTKLAEGDARAPVCSDCHTAHAITRAETPDFIRDIVDECGECHDRPEMAEGRRASFYATYRSSYHGQVSALGSTRAARCSDCHGSHDILPIADPTSRLHPGRRIETCRACHEGAPPRFAQFDPHADYLDSERYPLLHAVWWYFLIVISSTIGFFGLHSVLWFTRSLVERARYGPSPRPDPGAPAIRRFTPLNRINHALLIIPFFGLTLTGLPLLLSDRPWAHALARFFGGSHSMGILHRIFAIMLIGNFVVHLVGLVLKARAHRGPLVRDWLVGPNTMLPRWRDVRDCLGMFRWFFRGGRKPSFDRWTYWEKFDYLAEIAGTIIIGGTGLMLWFPIMFAHFMPGWMFNVASIVHGYEALLAVGFIFTIHFFNAHLRVEKFPVDTVMFTGSLPEEEFRHERADEFARLEAAGELDRLRVPPPPRWQRRVALVVGIVAMVIGFAVVAAIVIAGLHFL